MKILSICGGGVFGVGASAFLREMANHTADAKDYFDVFAGTSTGAIIAACLSIGMQSKDIEKLYDNNIKKIFTKYPWWKRRIPFSSCPTYDNRYFKRILKDVFGNIRMSDVGNLYIVAWRTNGKSRNKVFGPKDDTYIRDAVLASASAPTYFSTHVIGNEEFMDGGLWSNNPALCAVSDLVDDTPLDKMSMLTLVTGGKNIGRKTGNMNLIGTAKYLAERLLTGRVTGTDYICQKMIKDTLTIAPILTEKQDYGLDAVDDVRDIKKIWLAEYRKQDVNIRTFLRGIVND